MIQEPDWTTYGVASAVPEGIRAEIGSVIMLQGSIEFELRFCIARLLRLDPDTVETVSSELSYKQLMGLLSSLILRRISRGDGLYDDFVTAAGKLDQFEGFRNAVAHSHWSHSLTDFGNAGQAARHRTTSRRGQGLKRRIDEVTIDELQLQQKKGVFYMQQLFYAVQQIAERPGE